MSLKFRYPNLTSFIILKKFKNYILGPFILNNFRPKAYKKDNLLLILSRQDKIKSI